MRVANETASSGAIVNGWQRWGTTKVFDAMLETVGALVGRDISADMIDSTMVQVHQCTGGIKRELSKPRRLADHAVASPPGSTPDALPEASRAASC